MKVEIEESKLQTAYANACDGVKDFMESLFGKKVFEAAKPTLDDYKTIRTYEDACKALGEPIFEDPNNLPNHIIALMKLETISRALWGRNFQPKPDGEGSKVYWYPWFALWTKKEVEDMNSEQRGALLSAGAGDGAGAGFGCLGADGRSSGASAGFGYLTATSRSSYALANLGFRLCQETEEKAKYFGQQFIELWAEYLKFNFTVGNRLK